ncbi:hypothetical protein BH10BAC4_BH10BAC4_13760 [soil metagenome]
MKIFVKLYDWRIVAAISILLIILIYLPSGFVPDYFNLKRAIISGLFTRITISFISVFSFLVTVLILGYGFLREKFRRLALREFLDNAWVKILVTSFISVFLLNIFASIYLDTDSVNDNSLSIAYFCLILSLIYFIGFIPLALLTVASTDSLDLVGKYVAQFELVHFPEYLSHELLTTSNELNPIVVINSLSRSFAEKDDFHSINSILFSTQQKIQKLIGESTDRELIGRYLSGQRLIWDAIVHKAFQKKEFTVISNVFLMVSFYHQHFSEKKIPLLFLEEIRSFINSLMERLVEENVHTVIDDALRTFERIVENHYNKSVPNEDVLHQLTYFFEKTEENHKKAYSNPFKDIERMDNNLQWSQIHSDIPYIFSIVLQKAIEKKNRTIFDDAINSVAHLNHAAYISNMGNYHKAWIARLQAMEYYHYQLEAIKTNLITKEIEIKALDSVLDRMIDSDTLSKQYIFISTGEFMFELYNLSKLNLRSFNFIGSIGRHCANNYHLPGAKTSFEYILKLVGYFKNEFEKKLDKDFKNYRYLKEEVESFIQWHEMKPFIQTKLGEKDAKNENLDRGLIERLEKLSNEFKPFTPDETESSITWD